jgi:tetratricopeptide (TPR) repeat protein/tRNA A-37 threonylcarbamoyl transferase component Bud32
VVAFDAGAVVAGGRFRIIRLIARGGMGEVYEAEDLDLHVHVAVKTIRQDIAAHPQALSRFKRELHLTRQVTHPNVCRVFDFWQDRGGIAFVTMELLDGETLADRLLARGRLTPAEALPIIEQVCAALDAAHAAGIVHRDLKTGNIMLVPHAHGGEPARAVVTDFGIAFVRGEAETPGGSDIHLAGTPDYMAPEQVMGGEITTATDLYALGLVMYEMVTRSLPFAGETLETARKLKRENAVPSPRRSLPDLDARWEAAILRCLECDPKARFASAADVGAALTGRERPRAVRSVAVVGFRNQTGSMASAWLDSALAELIARELSATDGLRVVPRDDVAHALRDLGLDPAAMDGDEIPASIRARLHDLLAADLLVAGSYETGDEPGEGAGNHPDRPPSGSIDGSQRTEILLRLGVWDAKTGEVRAGIQTTGAPVELFTLASRGAAELRQVLGLDPLSRSEARGVRAGFPADPEALRLYAEGLACLRMYDDLGARECLQGSIGADPGFPLAHAALAEAWERLGHDARAETAARRAFELSAGLPREERLLVEARYREITRDWKRAIEIHRSLAVFFPDRPEHGMSLALAQIEAHESAEALQTIATLRSHSLLSSADPRLDLAEARAARQADLGRARTAAARAADRAAAMGARWIVARARAVEAVVLRDLGEIPLAEAAIAEAERLDRESGNLSAAAYHRMTRGILLRDRGALADALAVFEAAFQVFVELEHRKAMGTALNAMGALLDNLGEGRRAMDTLERALAIWNEIGNRAGASITIGNIGNLLALRGDEEGALRQYEGALAISREIGHRSNIAHHLNNISSSLVNLGDLEGARVRAEEALALQREVGDRAGLAWALHSLGEVLLDLDELPAAMRLLAEALQLTRESGEGRILPQMLCSLANASRRQGDLIGAERLAAEALAVAHEHGFRSLEADASFLIATINLARGDLDRARVSHQVALEIRAAVSEPQPWTRSRLALAELAIESGRWSEGERLAAELSAECSGGSRTDLHAEALLIRAHALRGLGDLASAESATNEAKALAARSQNRSLRRAVAIGVGEAQAALGRTAEAVRVLAAAAAEAQGAGAVDQELQARFALGEVEMNDRAQAGSGRMRLAALEREASTRGFLLIARRAAECLVRHDS